MMYSLNHPSRVFTLSVKICFSCAAPSLWELGNIGQTNDPSLTNLPSDNENASNSDKECLVYAGLVEKGLNDGVDAPPWLSISAG